MLCFHDVCTDRLMDQQSDPYAMPFLRKGDTNNIKLNI